MDASRIVEALTHHRALRSNPATFNGTPIGNNTSQSVSLSGADGYLFCKYSIKRFGPTRSFARIPSEESRHTVTESAGTAPHTNHAYASAILQGRRRFPTETTTDCIPSGRVDAELIIILHCQTGDTSAAADFQPFWDTTSYTIRTLEAKGHDTDFLFGYDWHWRKEKTCIDWGECSTAKWPQALKSLHDSFSSLFTILPDRFAFVGGACARKHVRNFLDTLSAVQRRSLSTLISPSAGIQSELDLVFTEQFEADYHIRPSSFRHVL